MDRDLARRLIEERFKKVYPSKRLRAVKLDGFSHLVAFDSGQGTEHEVEGYTHYAPELDCPKRAKELFEGIWHHSFQGNPFVYHWIE